jgi:CubicO group peptidase (beta-lactamase class C family)
MHDDLGSRLDRCVQASGFSGAVGVILQGAAPYRRASGLSDRERGVPNTLQTQFALASGTKGFTALALLALVADGTLALDAPVCSVLPEAAELLAPEATLRQLLSHTSGMGDYLDENELGSIEDYEPPLPAQQLTCPADFWPLLRGRAPKFPPGAGFSYCNSAYVLLARLLERASARPYHELVEQRVCRPAGMRQSAFLRLDQLPRNAARGYLPGKGWRSNDQNVPACGGGDGGLYSTLEDLECFWRALHAGRIVPAELVSEALRPQHGMAGQRPYGLGFWLTSMPRAAYLEGSDAGISFRSRYEPSTGLLYTVLSNTTHGAWPLVRELDVLLA